MEKDGVNFMFNTTPIKVEKDKGNEGQISFTYKHNDQEITDSFDTILVGTGRAPNVENLGLEKAGIEYDKNGVIVDQNLRSSNKRVFAIGDCIPGPKFTHNSDAQARMVIRNAMFRGNGKVSDMLIPYCTYTDPEIATVGLNEKLLKEQKI